MAANTEAIFDCLYLARSLEDELGRVSRVEVHLFCYLSCILWLYAERAVSDWGYTFVGTELGAPFSEEVHEAIGMLTARGMLSLTDDHLRLSEEARDRVSQLEGFLMYHDRATCLRAAAASMTALPVGVIGTALSEEPDLSRARDVPSSRKLLEESARESLFEQFAVLRSILNNAQSDLRVPAVAWLTSLHRLGTLRERYD